MSAKPNYRTKFYTGLKAITEAFFGRNRYSSHLKLQGPPCPNALSLSPYGTYLASGGDAGARIWSLPEGFPMQIPDYDPNALGQITALKWVPDGTREDVRLLVGTGLGAVIMWRLDIAEDRFLEKSCRENLHAGAVEAIAINGSKFAVVYREQMVIGFTLEDNGIRQDWMHLMNGTIPRSVAYYEEDILVWGMRNGSLYRLKGDTGRELDLKIFPEQIGNAVYRRCQNRVEYAIDILDEGCKVYRSPETREAQRFCRVPRTQAFAVCKQVLWIEDDRMLLIGSDHGLAYIYNDEDRCIQKIKHGGKDDIIQTLAACKTPSQYLIATTAMESDGVVRLWTKERRGETTKWDIIRMILLLIVAAVLLQSVVSSINDMAGSYRKNLIIIKANLSRVKMYLPAILMSLRNGIRRVVRAGVSRFGKFGKTMWNWVQKEERIKRATRKELYKKYRQFGL